MHHVFVDDVGVGVQTTKETHLGERATWVGQSPSWWLDHLQVIDELVVPSGKGPDQPTLKEQGNAPLRRMTTGLKEVDGSGGGPGGSEGFPA